jgi:hypothetical protein
MYDRRRGIYLPDHEAKPDAYEVNGNRRTLAELRIEWEASKEWGYTNESFDTWKARLTRQGVIKAIFKYRR